ncbi:APC family permease [Labilibaculum antarcticum]|uniref:Amino acid permease n=1 Tax=Labilibaculum antarcticum TaxID=1717717 RepID=A0A1Y1CQ19_9BACT|nr:APC family permease [Labilibaculum antarcticum]BAX82538.1 amino acid permease [Labilibaculum antarcticum]
MNKKKLGVLASTAICGNDISSSVLYVSALSIGFAGQYAWITLLIVAVVLFLFRKIYGEVVGALPLNGGAYNALLNTTSKSTASLAATLTILSYMATAVISANEAMHYCHHIFSQLPIMIATVGLLLVFAVLTISGITESSKVATGIFIFHLFSLSLLAVFIIKHLLINGFSQFLENWNLPVEGSITIAIFLGFSASMLGISGFESSANFVEEQQPGVFRKTLLNMWIVVSIINPLMAFLALSLVPIPEIRSEYSTTLLSHMGSLSSGEWLSTLISIDAVLVLSGAVLTSYIGVSGLLERMTLDRVLPQFFLRKNKKGSSYRIIIMFFILSVSVLLITNGNVGVLAGVYTISFLSVMFLFGFGNILLKVRRAKLPRPETATWLSVIVAIIAVIVALVGNVIMEPQSENAPSNVSVFLSYFIPAIIFISIMLNRVAILRGLLGVSIYIFNYIKNWFLQISSNLNNVINSINAQQFIYFAKRDNIAILNKVMLYIKSNEHTKNLKIVHVVDPSKEDESEFIASFKKVVEIINEEYPEIEVEALIIEGIFGPELIKELSAKWKVPINFMFIASPGDHFLYKVEELGGVRLII